MSTYVGIDVSKHCLDVALAQGGAFRVSYDEPGLKALLAQMTALAPQLIILEATGGLQIRAAGELAAMFADVSIE